MAALVAYEAEVRAKEAYFGNALWLISQEIAAFGGAKSQLPSFSEIFAIKKTPKDNRSAKQIINGLASRLKRKKRKERRKRVV